MKFGVLGSFFGSDEGVGRGLARNGPKGSETPTKVGILAIVWGQKSPSSSYSGWSGVYSIGTPCIAELIPERVGPVIFKKYLLWERELIPDRAYPAIKSENVEKLIPGTILPDPL